MKDIGLIEDDKILRETCTKYFKITETFNVIFSVNDINDTLNFKHTRPEIILLDVNLESGSSIDSISLIKNTFKNSKVVMLSNVEDANLTKRAWANGAVGYLLKSSSLAYIVESLLKIDDGGTPFSPETISHMLPPVNAEDQKGDYELTRRELELINLLSEGLANKTAADKLNVTYFTINQHLKNIYKKLAINSKSELIAWYLNKKR